MVTLVLLQLLSPTVEFQNQSQPRLLDARCVQKKVTKIQNPGVKISRWANRKRFLEMLPSLDLGSGFVLGNAPKEHRQIFAFFLCFKQELLFRGINCKTLRFVSGIWEHSDSFVAHILYQEVSVAF